MSQKTHTLKSEPRTRLGSRASRALRASDRIPASMDASGGDPRLDFAIPETEFMATRRHHTHLYEIEIGSTKQLSVVRELQWDTFGERILHVDFKRVRADVETDSEVELEFTGHPKGGVLNHLISHVTVRCVPRLIPDSIEVAVTGLEVGNAIYARDLRVPEGVKLLLDPNARVAQVLAAQKLEVATPAAAEGAAAPAAGETPAAPATPAS